MDMSGDWELMQSNGLSVTHDEVYLEQLRTALRQRYRAKINEHGRVVGGVTTDAFNRAYSFTANSKAHLRLPTVHAPVRL